MPDITKYLQRVSFLLRQGEPANDVAVYLPTEDAWSEFTAGKVSINQAMPALLGSELIPAILDAGFNFDFTDDRAIQQVGITHPVLVLPHLSRMPQETSKKIADFKRKGVVVEVGRLTDLARLYT